MLDKIKITWQGGKVYVSGDVSADGAKMLFDVSGPTKQDALNKAHSAIGVLVGKVAKAQTDIMSK